MHGCAVQMKLCTVVSGRTVRMRPFFHLTPAPSHLQDIMPGCAIKMQLCARANSLEEAFSRMKGAAFSCEVKLDGYRLQVGGQRLRSARTR